MDTERAYKQTLKKKMAMANKEIKAIESLNWVYHMHYIRGEFEMCEKQMDRFGYMSNYALYLKGMIRLKSGKVNEALKIFTDMSTKSQNPMSFKAMIRCLILLGRHATVCELVRDRGMYASASDAQVWYLIGTSFYHQGSYALAKDAFQKATLSTNKPDAFLMLAKVHLKEGDSKAAILVLRRASEISPEDQKICMLLGNLLISAGMSSKGAEKLLTLAHSSAVTPDNLALSLSVGGVLQDSKGDIEAALFRYKIANSFESPSLWNNVALCFASRKKMVGAISCLQRAVYLNPLDWRLTYNLAIILMQMRQFASAFHHFKSSASMSAGSPHVVSMLAFCLQRLEDDVNANQAHLSASKAAMTVQFPNPLLNYAVFLYNQDPDRNKDNIMDLLMEFEKMWVKRRQGNGSFDMEVIRLATRIASLMHVAHHMAWIRTDNSVSLTENTTSSSPLATTIMVDPGVSTQNSQEKEESE
jgi:Bardet-Biedl syndrome 4 protein